MSSLPQLALTILQFLKSCSAAADGRKLRAADGSPLQTVADQVMSLPPSSQLPGLSLASAAQSLWAPNRLGPQLAPTDPSDAFARAVRLRQALKQRPSEFSQRALEDISDEEAEMDRQVRQLKPTPGDASVDRLQWTARRCQDLWLLVDDSHRQISKSGG